MGLPPGAHPRDRQVVGVPFELQIAREPEHEPRRRRKFRGWWTTHEAAAPVFQRLSDAWQIRTLAVTAQNSPTVLAARTRGRTYLSLWVPTYVPVDGAMVQTTAGVMVANSRAELDGGQGAPVNVGDAHAILSEGPLWVALQPGTSEGFVCYQHCWSPPTGALDR